LQKGIHNSKEEEMNAACDVHLGATGKKERCYGRGEKMGNATPQVSGPRGTGEHRLLKENDRATRRRRFRGGRREGYVRALLEGLPGREGGGGHAIISIHY